MDKKFSAEAYRNAISKLATKNRIAGKQDLSTMGDIYRFLKDELNSSYSKITKWGNQKYLDSGKVKAPTEDEIAILESVLGQFMEKEENTNTDAEGEYELENLKKPLLIYFDELEYYPYLSKLLPCELYSHIRVRLNGGWEITKATYEGLMRVLADYSDELQIEVHVLIYNYLNTRITPFMNEENLNRLLEVKEYTIEDFEGLLRASFREEVLKKINQWGKYL